MAVFFYYVTPIVSLISLVVIVYYVHSIASNVSDLQRYEWDRYKKEI